MRDALENINLLQKRMNDLQLENQVLKEILERSGISYADELRKYQIRMEQNCGRKIKAGELYIRSVLRMRWRINFTVDSGGDRMYTVNVP